MAWSQILDNLDLKLYLFIILLLISIMIFIIWLKFNLKFVTKGIGYYDLLTYIVINEIGQETHRWQFHYLKYIKNKS